MRTPMITVLDHHSMKLLLLGLLIVIGPHLAELPWWIGGLALSVGIWRWRASVLGWKLPVPSIRIIFTLFIITLIFAQFGSAAGRDAGVALLVAMMALKLLELKAKRDILVLVFISYFMLGTHFLYSQSIPMVIYVFSATWIFVGLHIHLSFMDSQPLKVSLRTAGTLLAQALPLMLILFVLFPRLPGPIWNLPKDSYEGMSGLDDSMSPGNISNLSQSDEIAFRVKFTGAMPPSYQRYWRGPVLTLTDGRSWTAAPNLNQHLWHPPQLERKQNPVSYTVTLEPHNRKWLFALDLPARPNEQGQIRSDYQLVTGQPVRQRLRYEMVSYLDYSTGALPPAEEEMALALPERRNPRAVELGKKLRMQSSSDVEVVRRALKMFREQPYVYTLRPPLLSSRDPADEFLFESLRGFCEHYASSFVVLMRAAGIPARVVTGYQGGEVNSVGNYLIVRQRDAHAWAEVWLTEAGWTRFDPTAAVAPQRVESGIDTSSTSTIGGAIRFQLGSSNELAKLMRELRLGMDTINNGWNQFVLGYGPDEQAEFLRSFGLDIRSWKQLAWTLGIGVSSVFLITTLLILLKREPEKDPIQKCYLTFCRKLEKLGFKREKNETASDYASRVAQQRPDLSVSIHTIVGLYSYLRYSEICKPQQMARFKKLVNTFKP
ncbi:DUF3488 and DUF4129 domain-containing transglutaminase family protein [Pseudomonadota bacterium]